MGRRADLSRHDHQLSLAKRARRVTLKDEMGISTQQYSYIVAAFQLGYTFMQPVCGLVVDYVGLRLGFALFAA